VAEGPSNTLRFVPHTRSESSDSEMETKLVYEVKRTFVEVSLTASLLSASSAQIKTVSTSGANAAVVDPRHHKIGTQKSSSKNSEVLAQLFEQGPRDLGGPAPGQKQCSLEEREKWIKRLTDKDTVMGCWALQFAPARVCADKEVMLAVIRAPEIISYSSLLEYSPFELRADRDFIWQCVESDAGVFQFTPNELKEDFERVLHAAQHDGRTRVALLLRGSALILTLLLQQSGITKTASHGPKMMCSEILWSRQRCRKDGCAGSEPKKSDSVGMNCGRT